MNWDDVNIGNAREHIIRSTSQKEEVDPFIVEKIFNFQFKDVVEATRTVKSIEINGLCRLVIHDGQIQRRINKMNNSILKNQKLIEAGVSDKRRKSLENKIEGAQQVISTLCKRLENEN